MGEGPLPLCFDTAEGLAGELQRAADNQLHWMFDFCCIRAHSRRQCVSFSEATSELMRFL